METKKRETDSCVNCRKMKSTGNSLQYSRVYRQRKKAQQCELSLKVNKLKSDVEQLRKVVHRLRVEKSQLGQELSSLWKMIADITIPLAKKSGVLLNPNEMKTAESLHRRLCSFIPPEPLLSSPPAKPFSSSSEKEPTKTSISGCGNLSLSHNSCVASDQFDLFHNSLCGGSESWSEKRHNIFGGSEN